MKLKKIINFDCLQAYSIINPSKKFKLMFPYKYIFITCINGYVNTYNTDKIPIEFAYAPIVGYIFTYEKKLPDFFNSAKVNKYTNLGSTFPSCLDQYFTSSEGDEGKEIDLILSCSGRNDEVPIYFKDTLIIRCNSYELIGNAKSDIKQTSKNIKINILKILNLALIDDIDKNTEEWTINIIQNAPLNDNGFPLKYPKLITDSLFKKSNIKDMKKINKDLIFIEYDFRAKNYEHENNFIYALEEAFEDMNAKVEIFDTYNGILKNIVEEMDKKRLKYKKVTDHSIETTLKNIRSLDITFQLTDFI